jgi:hypothetical protein
MANLDRRGWPVHVAVDAYGMLVAVRASNTSAIAGLRRVLPPGAEPIGAASCDITYSLLLGRNHEETHIAFENDRAIAEGNDLDSLLEAVESELHFTVAVRARTHLFVHAGVVGWRGGAILLPGRTHSGKSALVAELVRAGASYYSDEYAVVDEAGLVHPFARSLGIRDMAGRIRRVDPATLGKIGQGPLPVSLVVATRHVPQATWQPLAMSRGEIVLALLANTLAARARARDTLRFLSRAATNAFGLRGDRGEAKPVVARLLGLVPGGEGN